MLDRAQCLSKYQAAKGIVDSEMWDLQRRNNEGRKELCRHASNSRYWSVTFHSFQNCVAVEDSSTLLDNAIAMIEELCDTYVWIKLLRLQKMCAVMSDRVSVNKAFNEKFNEFDFLKQFFALELILIVVSETNEYAKTQGARNWSDVTTAELSAFMGLHILFSVL